MPPFLAIYQFRRTQHTRSADGAVILERGALDFARQQAGYPSCCDEGQGCGGLASFGDFAPGRLSPHVEKLGLCRRAGTTGRHRPQLVAALIERRHALNKHTMIPHRARQHCLDWPASSLALPRSADAGGRLQVGRWLDLS